MNINADDFYERIKDLLKENKKSLDDLMAIKGLSFNAKSTYFSMRQAHNLPRADDALRIADFLGVSVEYLITGKEPDSGQKINDVIDNLKTSIESLQILKNQQR